MGENEFNRAELHAISLMQKARKTLPEDFWLVPAMQELACLYARIEPLLTDAQKSTMIGCGAIMAREAEKEMRAGIHAAIAISNAMPSRNRHD